MFSWSWQKILVAGGVLFLLQAVLSYASYQEISWKEFYSRFLEANLVSNHHFPSLYFHVNFESTATNTTNGSASGRSAGSR